MCIKPEEQQGYTGQHSNDGCTQPPSPEPTNICTKMYPDYCKDQFDQNPYAKCQSDPNKNDEFGANYEGCYIDEPTPGEGGQQTSPSPKPPGYEKPIPTTKPTACIKNETNTCGYYDINEGKCYRGTGASGYNVPGCEYTCGSVSCKDLENEFGGGKKSPPDDDESTDPSCKGTLSYSCGPYPKNKIKASWKVNNENGECNIYIRDSEGDHVISDDCSGQWSANKLPGGEAITNDGRYELYVSNGGSCDNSKADSTALSCGGGGGGESSACGIGHQSPTISSSCMSCIMKERGSLPKEIRNLNSGFFSSCTDTQVVQYWCNGGISDEANGECSDLKSSCGNACGSAKKSSSKKSSKSEEEDDNKKRKEQNKGNTKKRLEKEKAEEKKKKEKEQKKTPTSTPTLTPSPTPTPLPPLPSVGNIRLYCGPTTDPKVDLGIEITWDPSSGAKGYAVRVDEDTPSWGGDHVNPGDTVENNITQTRFVRKAKYDSHYQVWIHNINASGVYSRIDKKPLITCPKSPSTTAGGNSNIGASRLIVWPTN